MAAETEHSQKQNGQTLFGADFDNTVALTFEKPVSGVGVHEAYEIAVEDVFDTRTRDEYMSKGGLRNRAPLQVVTELKPDANGGERFTLVDSLIRVKLAVLMGQIGTPAKSGGIWPRPTEGYLELLDQIEQARRDQIITHTILSSGHEPFIAKTFETWGVRQPDHVIAVETIDRLSIDHPKEKLVKPSPILMQVMYETWLQGLGQEPAATPCPEELADMIYVGDDDEKDGNMARAFGVDFVLLDPDHERSKKIWVDVGIRLLGHNALTGADQRV